MPNKKSRPIGRNSPETKGIGVVPEGAMCPTVLDKYDRNAIVVICKGLKHSFIVNFR